MFFIFDRHYYILSYNRNKITIDELLNRNSKDIFRNSIVFPLFVLYILFVPIGPYPFFIGPIRFEVIIGIALFFSLIKWIPYLRFYPKKLIQSALLFLFIGLLSVVFSEDQNESLYRFFIFLGYICVSFLAPLALTDKIKFIRKLLFIFGFITALVSLYLYFFKGYGHNFRFALGPEPLGRGSLKGYIDPNMTAIGLMITLLVYIPNITEHKSNFYKISIETIIFITVFLSVIITLSRTAILSSVISLFISTFVYLYFRKVKLIRFNKYFFMFLAIFFLVYQISNKILPDKQQLLFSRFEDATENLERASLVLDAIKLTFTDVKVFVIGKGFFLANPHNDIIRFLVTTGFLGALSLLFFLYCFFIYSVMPCRSVSLLFFGSLVLYFYIFLAIQTYGHTKSLSIVYMFILFLFIESKVFKTI